jgi:hypothetical protein
MYTYRGKDKRMLLSQRNRRTARLKVGSHIQYRHESSTECPVDHFLAVGIETWQMDVGVRINQPYQRSTNPWLQRYTDSNY